MRLKIIPIVLTAVITTLITLFIAAKFQDKQLFIAQPKNKVPVNYASFNPGSPAAPMPANFEMAAEASVQAVVHINTQTASRTVIARDPNFGDDFFGDIFGQRQYFIPPQKGSGSGVVISPDGYIVTNYHVIANADKVTVTFNDRYTTEATVVGKDASTDIAVLKVDDESNIPYMEYGNSDDVHLGQWVLAVGYPFTLDATVTAGIVSAKSRSVGINRTQSASAIESFIQTDAAVNPGNSGGALVNTSGQLIGINSAIASPTGSYAGYSYAIPSNIVRKVVDDIIRYGSVQRAYLGIQYLDRKMLTPQQISELGLDKSAGVYIANVVDGSGAAKAGLREGDFVIAINGATVNTAPDLLGQIARFKPGDNVSITYTRGGREYHTTVLLKNAEGTTSIIRNNNSIRMLGASFRTLTVEEKAKLGINGGVLVTDINSGALASQTNMKKGFIITSVNDKAVGTVEDLQQLLAAGNGKLQLAGIYPGVKGKYYYGLSNTDEVEGYER